MLAHRDTCANIPKLPYTRFSPVFNSSLTVSFYTDTEPFLSSIGDKMTVRNASPPKEDLFERLPYALTQERRTTQ